MTRDHIPARLVRDRNKALNKFSLVGTARLEARYMKEWIQYHLSIGFDHIYIYCNDDCPDECYEAVLPFLNGLDPSATFVYYQFQGLQNQMFLHFIRNFSANSQWTMFLDLDEFVFLGEDNQLEPFVRQFELSADAIYFNWLMFGHNGFPTRPSGSVLKNYTRREEHVSPFTKILIRSDKIDYLSLCNNPTFPMQHDCVKHNSIRTVNVLGESMDDYYTQFPSIAWAFLHADERKYLLAESAFVAHYSIKSDEDFQHRITRGLIGDYAVERIWGEVSEQQKKELHERQNRVVDDRLSHYWTTYLSKGRLKTVFPPAASPLVTRNKPAIQSSTAHPLSNEDDAHQLVDGDYSANAHNHTMLEQSPWWQVDLQSPHIIDEIRLFNRLELIERMRNFRVDTSMDGEHWSHLFSKKDSKDFGGVESAPFVKKINPPIKTRHVRITLLGDGYLHLRQVEIYGFAEMRSEEMDSYGQRTSEVKLLDL